MIDLTREQLTQIRELLANLYPEQNAARAMWVRAGGEAGYFYHAPMGIEMWSHNFKNIQSGRRGCPSVAALLKQALTENPEQAALIQAHLNELGQKEGSHD